MRTLGFEPVLINTSLQGNANVILKPPVDAKGFSLHLVVSDNGGTTPTLDVKVKHRFPSGVPDIVGAAFAQITTAAFNGYLTVYPGIAAVANQKVSDVIVDGLRVDFTLGGTPNYNVSCFIAWIG